MLFIEQHVDTPVNSERINRFWFSCNAWGGTCTILPWTMTDSGYNTQSGYSAGFTANSQAMIYNSLARPPKATITATASRVGDHFQFSVSLKNLSGVTLSSSNAARLFAIIYEVKTPDLTTHLTTHPVRAMVSTGISSLADNASAVFTLDTPDLSGVAWENLRPAVIADYRPGGAGVGYYDTLQAAFIFEGVQVYLPVVVR